MNLCKLSGHRLEIFNVNLAHSFTKHHDVNSTGGTIFIDHASGCIHLHDQVSLHIGEVLQGKHHFEQFANEHGVTLQSFRADDHPFQAKAFLDDLELQDQTITCSGVGAHHQAGVAERGAWRTSWPQWSSSCLSLARINSMTHAVQLGKDFT